MRFLRRPIASLVFLSGLVTSAQGPVTLRVDTAQATATVSPMLYGLMTEEINYSYDGGLYAEMLRNRTFASSWSGVNFWQASVGGNSAMTYGIADDGPSAALHRSLRLTISAASAGSEAGISNPGYWGMAVRPSTTYAGSFYAKADQELPMHAALVDNRSGAVIAQAEVQIKAGPWNRYTYTMTTGTAVRSGADFHFLLSSARPGTVLLQLVSLMPPTYHNTPNGNRVDLMERMAAMHPAFLRLPGGNYLEGDTFKERYNWKEQIGPLVDRPTHRSPWNYQSSDGEGLMEMLRWCEDLHIQPVLALFAGYSLKGEHVEGAQLQPYIDAALDEIEYVTGDASTKWGAQRAKDGHPAPFPLHFIEIGNEDDLDKSGSYSQRFNQFAEAIRAKYGRRFELIATTPVTMGTPDLIDDHFYRSAEEMFAMAHYYDGHDRNGPKIFVGEWATRIGSPTPNMEGALGDAAWMTGMERNSDLIVMASYAPLFTNVNPGGMQWSSDLIGYDADTSYGSPSYWAQVMFANHLGDHVVASATDHKERRFFWSSTVSHDGRTLFLKLVNGSDKPQPLNVEIPGARNGAADMETLHADSGWATNSIRQPNFIVPVKGTARLGSHWQTTLAPYTIEVVDVPLK